ncbi:hypothetical protein DPMN_005798 [Dreissena polymorpha]|uniref:Uncharacterized protein n=1 Tax=Dreissena polymorpha TaxID=45954 RepID=A0A9D4MSV7_DREPO|nr:hypothetical protein DPMN_005798 [Dreissena polymorpha]
MSSRVLTRKNALPLNKLLTRKMPFPWGAPGLVMGPCIVEIDRIVIREVQYQLEVNLCRNEEIIVKDNFGWVWPIMGGAPKAEIDRIVIKECRNEEIIVKDNFGLAWPMWPGRPRVGNGAMHIEIDCIVIREAQYQIEEQVTRTDGQMHITTISPLFLRKTWG